MIAWLCEDKAREERKKRHKREKEKKKRSPVLRSCVSPDAWMVQIRDYKENGTERGKWEQGGQFTSFHREPGAHLICKLDLVCHIVCAWGTSPSESSWNGIRVGGVDAAALSPSLKVLKEVSWWQCWLTSVGPSCLVLPAPKVSICSRQILFMPGPSQDHDIILVWRWMTACQRKIQQQWCNIFTI